MLKWSSGSEREMVRRVHSYRGVSLRDLIGPKTGSESRCGDGGVCQRGQMTHLMAATSSKYVSDGACDGGSFGMELTSESCIRGRT